MSPEPPITRAISIRQPFVEMILDGTKPIEYRSRRTNIRERVWLYASKTPENEVANEEGYDIEVLPRGRIVGSVEIVDCTESEEDYGTFEWHLANPSRLKKHLIPVNQPQPGIWRPQFADE